MTAERRTDETRSALDRLRSLTSDCDATHEERFKMHLLIAEAEQEQAEKIRKLEDMLRLAHDKCAEQVRQARWEVAHTALTEYGRENMRLSYLQRVLDANVTKDLGWAEG